MTINSTTRKTNNLAGNGNTHTYPFAFKVFADSEIVVKKLEVSTSTETTLTLGVNNDYIVTLNQDQNGNPGGSITLKSGGNNYNLPSGFQIVITSAVQSLQGTDLTNQGGFYPEVINDALDKSAILHQQQQDELDRSIKFSLTNTIGSLEVTESATARANKVMAFDTAGELTLLNEIGTYRGNWAASTAYVVRDLVKDTSTNNVFMCNVAHTSSGSQPLTTNTDSAKWDLIVDAATATTQANTATAQATAAASSAAAALTSKNAAAASATAAATSETNANTHKNDAQTAKTAAETAKTAAETAKTAAEAALDSFDDRYLGAKSSDPTLDNDGNALLDGAIYWNTSSNVTKIYDLGNTSWDLLKLPSSDQTKVNTVAGISSDVTAVAGIASNVTAVAGNATNINAVAGNNSNITSVANNSSNINSAVSNASNINAAVSNASNINAVAGNASNINTVAGNNSNINTVAGANSNINTVATNISNVNAIATDIAKIQTVADDLNETVSEIETAANDLNETTSEIDTVANAITNVDNVGNNIANVNTVAGIASEVTAVAGNASNVNTVGGAITNVNNVGNNIANVNTCATNLSGINSFAERYRTDNTGNNPSSNNDAGDLFYNQGSGKLLVYNGNTSAWEETQSVGNFFINTLSAYSGTGGNSSGNFDNSAIKFTLSNAGQFAQQMLVSINGVVQKPNTGTGQPSEGFALDGAVIVFSSAPPTGADYFIVTIGASVSIGTPSNNTITNAMVTANAAIAGTKISPDFGSQNVVTTGTLGSGDITVSSAIPKISLVDTGHNPDYDILNTNGTFQVNDVTNGAVRFRINSDGHVDFLTNVDFASGIDVTGTVAATSYTGDGSNLTGINTDLVGDTSPQLGGYLDTNGHNIQMLDGDRLRIGTSFDLQLYHDQNHSYISDTGTGQLRIRSNDLRIQDTSGNSGIQMLEGGAVYLYHAGNQKFETTSWGVLSGGYIKSEGSSGKFILDNDGKFSAGDSNDLEIYHNGSNSYLKNTTNYPLWIQNNSGQDINISDGSGGNLSAKFNIGDSAELYHAGNIKLSTTSDGIDFGTAGANDIICISGLTIHRTGSNGCGLHFTSNALYPTNAAGATVNGSISLGSSGNKFSWIHANGLEIADRVNSHLRPYSTNTFDLGSSTYRWRNVYTNDLNLSNEGSTNDVDGTWGSYTIQEGEESLFLINKRNGKKYKFNLTEVS